MTEAGSGSGKPFSSTDVLLQVPTAALESLGIGVAILDGNGRLTSADTRFADHLRLKQPLDQTATNGPWTELLGQSTCGLPVEDARALTAVWESVLSEHAQAIAASRVLRLTDSRWLELGGGGGPQDTVLVTVSDVTQRIGSASRSDSETRLIHDINNLLGGILAHLHLGLSDLDPDHPARPRLEAVNRSAIEIRALAQDLASRLSGNE